MVSLVQGTGIRGQFEERMQNSWKKFANVRTSSSLSMKSMKLSVLVPAGDGNMDAGNILKPALARELQLVGATTLNEYRIIEKMQP